MAFDLDEHALQWFRARKAFATRRDRAHRRLREGIERALRGVERLTTPPAPL